jgi:hypothetical protein
MSHVEDPVLNKPRQRASSGKQPLVVRGAREDSLPEILDKLSQLESSLASVKEDLKAVTSRGESKKLGIQTLVALTAVALSIAGYVIQDARNASRQDTEIESAKARLAVVERIQAVNTEGRIRMEVELQQLRQGQEEIKRMLERHDIQTRNMVRQKQ